MASLIGKGLVSNLLSSTEGEATLKEFADKQYKHYCELSAQRSMLIPPDTYAAAQFAAIANNYRSLLHDLERFVEGAE